MVGGVALEAEEIFNDVGLMREVELGEALFVVVERGQLGKVGVPLGGLGVVFKVGSEAGVIGRCPVVDVDRAADALWGRVGKGGGAAEKSLAGELGESVGGGAFGRLWVEMAAELVGRQEAGAGKAVDGVEVWGVEACAFAWVHRHSLGLVRVGNGCADCSARWEKGG